MTRRSAPGLAGRLQGVWKRPENGVGWTLISGLGSRHAKNGAVSGWRRLPDLCPENGRFSDAATQGLKIGTTAP